MVNFLQPEVPNTKSYICRRVSPGPVAYSMFAILALTYLFIKIRTPKLPANHKGQGFMKVTVFVAVGWMVAFIAYTSFMVNGRHTKMEELLISHIISNLFGNVFIPLYYIYNTPKLCKYVNGFFVRPSICRPNQVVSL